MLIKVVTFLHGDGERVGAVDGEAIVDVSAQFPTMLSLIEAGAAGLAAAQRALQSDHERIPMEGLSLLAPIPRVGRNIVCVGWNYLAHFNERFRQDIDLPERPAVFTKATGTVAGPMDEIPVSAAYTQKLDYEAELAVVIGKGGWAIPESQAMAHVFGYMAANDLSARDVQNAHGGQWFLGKSMDKSCPMGPWLVTQDEVPDPHCLDITCTVNGATVQSSNTALMMFSVSQIIAELSRGMTLVPGDVILTGTPSGVGFKRTPPLFLRPGDEVEVSIAGIGSIKNRIIHAVSD